MKEPKRGEWQRVEQQPELALLSLLRKPRTLRTAP